MFGFAKKSKEYQEIISNSKSPSRTIHSNLYKIKNSIKNSKNKKNCLSGSPNNYSKQSWKRKQNNEIIKIRESSYCKKIIEENKPKYFIKVKEELN